MLDQPLLLGDRFSVETNNGDRNYGTVTAIAHYSHDTVYHVHWDHFLGIAYYNHSDVQDDWTKESVISINLQAPVSLDYIPLTLDIKKCDHKWQQYHGFTESYEFCKHCDAKR